MSFFHEDSKVPVDIREFIGTLLSHRRVLSIGEPVSPDSDVESVLRSASQPPDSSSCFFSQTLTASGSRLAVDLLDSWENCALGFGLRGQTCVGDLIRSLCYRTERYRYTPKEVSAAPVFEHVTTNHVDLFRQLPLVRMSGGEDSTYIYNACIVSEDPISRSTGTRLSFGMYAVEVVAPDNIRVSTSGTDNLTMHIAAATRLGCQLPVSICLGVPPVVLFVAALSSACMAREYDLISEIQKYPLQLVRSLTSKLLVPACSEYLLEGVIKPEPTLSSQKIASCQEKRSIMKVTSIAHRDRPILHNMRCGRKWTERDCLSGLAAALRFYRDGKDILTQVAKSGVAADRAYLRLEYLPFQAEVLQRD